MRGTPYYYFGDELGMNNIEFDKIEDYRDIETIAMYQQTKNQGGDLTHFLNGQKIGARDNGRTPFQWNANANAGFTTGTPWLKVNDNHTEINVEAENKDPNSILNYFRKMVKLRKELPELVYGKYTLLDKDNDKIYAYTRTLGDKKVLVLLNFSTATPTISIPVVKGKPMRVLANNVSNIDLKKNVVTMQPWQALVIRLK